MTKPQKEKQEVTIMSFFRRLFGDKGIHRQHGQDQPTEQGRCRTCSRSQSPACTFPYSEEETARFMHIGILFQQSVTPEDAMQQLVKQHGWHDQSTRNCVNLTYARMEEVKGYAPYKTAESTKKAIRRHEQKGK